MVFYYYQNAKDRKEVRTTEWMKLQEIALKHGVSIKTMYHLNKNGLGPKAHKFGRQYMVKIEDYATWVRESECSPE